MDDLLAEIDTSEFLEAIKLYEQNSSKDFAASINHAAQKLCEKAAAETFSARAAEINKFDPKKTGKSRAVRKRSRLHYALASNRGVRKGDGIRKAAETTFNKRKSALGYSKAVWYALAKDFGARLRGKFKLDGPKGKVATPWTLSAKLETGSLDQDHVSQIMEDSLKKGMLEAATSLTDHALKQMEKNARKYSS